MEIQYGTDYVFTKKKSCDFEMLLCVGALTARRPWILENWCETVLEILKMGSLTYQLKLKNKNTFWSHLAQMDSIYYSFEGKFYYNLSCIKTELYCKLYLHIFFYFYNRSLGIPILKIKFLYFSFHIKQTVKVSCLCS